MTLEEKKAKLFGNHVLIVTPLNNNGEIDEKSTRNLVDFVIEKGVHGILALGSTGEVFALTESERKQFIEIVIDQTNGRVPVGVGVNDSSTDTAILLAKHAESYGVDYIFTCPPYYHPHGAEGIYRHIKYICEATALPVMVYDGGAGIEISLPLLKRMADTLPTIFAAKLFLPYAAKIGMYNDATDDKVQAWAGHDQLNFLMLCYGANGMTSAASCVIPNEQTKIFELVKSGNVDEARNIFHDVVAPLNSIAFANVLQYPQCYKKLLMWMGVIETDTCKPVMEPIDDIRTRELRAIGERLGLIK